MIYCLVASTLTSLIYFAMTSALGKSTSNVALGIMALMFLFPVNALVGYVVSSRLARQIDWPFFAIALIPLVVFFIGLPVVPLALLLVYVGVSLVCIFGAYKGRKDMLNNQKQADAQKARAAV